MRLLFYPWITTTHLLNKFSSFETSATALCGGTAGILWFIFELHTPNWTLEASTSQGPAPWVPRKSKQWTAAVWQQQLLGQSMVGWLKWMAQERDESIMRWPGQIENYLKPQETMNYKLSNSHQLFFGQKRFSRGWKSRWRCNNAMSGCLLQTKKCTFQFLLGSDALPFPKPKKSELFV